MINISMNLIVKYYLYRIVLENTSASFTFQMRCLVRVTARRILSSLLYSHAQKLRFFYFLLNKGLNIILVNLFPFIVSIKFLLIIKGTFQILFFYLLFCN